MTTDSPASSSAPLAAMCLTAPAAGGVAVIRVQGRGAVERVAPFLRGRKAVGLPDMSRRELRLCQWADGDETIDDAVIAVRHDGPEEAIDVNLHGGQRIVQRVLLMLRDAGVRIVDAAEAAADAWPARHAIEREAFDALMRAPTQRVALWLTRMIEALPDELRRIGRLVDTNPPQAVDAVEQLLARADAARVALQGVRVVLCGEPNTGKSTLANALAEYERAIVSDVPGTTRDWIEHPTAIAGIPVTVIDTAGIRTTRDAIEREAIRRGTAQQGTADVVLHVLDATRETARPSPPVSSTDPRAASVVALNKSDQLSPEELARLGRHTEPGALAISALNRAGLDELRRSLLAAAGLGNWSDTCVAPFTRRQVRELMRCLSALRDPRRDAPRAHADLDALISEESLREDPH